MAKRFVGNIAFNSYFGGRKMKIKEVILQANSFSGLKNFYVDVLGLMVLQEETNRISFEVGSSILTFNESGEHQSPYYHFAFNITENKREQAVVFLKNKFVKINQNDGQDQYYNESWNCHSIYFFDPLGNIVEFIARHNLLEDGHGDFSAKDIKNITSFA
jgi:catechol-2,3-dioxygenase